MNISAVGKGCLFEWKQNVAQGRLNCDAGFRRGPKASASDDSTICIHQNAVASRIYDYGFARRNSRCAHRIDAAAN